MPANKPKPSSIASGLERTLSKSRFKTAFQCPTKLYYQDRKSEYANKKDDDTFLKSLAKGGFQVGALAKLYFPGGVEVETKNSEQAVSETLALLQQENITLFEAAFRFGNLLVRADIVRKEGSKIHLYEVKSRSWSEDKSFWQKRNTDRLNTEWKEYLYDIAFQHFVVKEAFPQWKIIPYLYLVDKDKVASVDGLNQNFRLIEKEGRSQVQLAKPLSKADVGTELLIAKEVSLEVGAIQSGKPNGDSEPDWPGQITFGEWVHSLEEMYLKDQMAPPKVSPECKSCEFRIQKKNYPGKKSGFEECWTKALSLREGTLEKRIPIFDIWSLISRRLLDSGVHFVDQLSESDLLPKSKPKKPAKSGMAPGDRKVLQWQRTLEESKEYRFLKSEFSEEAAEFQYPLHFIDFETTLVAIPFNKGLRPYEQIAFQFSHHVLQKDGSLTHANQWIHFEPGTFPNFEFVRALKKALSADNGTIFRYATHENSVLCAIRTQLQAASLEQVPDKAELIAWIESITQPRSDEAGAWTPSRPMVDLLDLVKRFFWHPRMGGSNSIKVVLPSILECSEHLQKVFSQPIYGSADFKSHNYENFTWLRKQGSQIEDPYLLLPAVLEGKDNQELDRLYGDGEESEEIKDGGAAMMAFAKMQFSEMPQSERLRIRDALLRYCELDTLAMALLWIGWTQLAEK